MKPMNLPDTEGVWWYEHAENPVLVKRERAYGDRLCGYVLERWPEPWAPVDELLPGWWQGPLSKPGTTEELITGDPDIEARRLEIVGLAQVQHHDYWEDIEIDSDAQLSEGDDNGCYVQAWVWFDFAGTKFDKEKG
jgi:hypothetical protein